MNNYAQIIDQVVAIAKMAGEDIMSIYKTQFSVTQKHDNTPLTEADMAAHKRIVSGLTKLTPELPVLSEESAEIPFSTRKGWQRYWLVDPLDGTREFIKRNDEFTVNIALIDGSKAIMGVIYIPASEVCYFAYQAGGAFKQEQAQSAHPIHVRPKPKSTCSIAGSRSHRGESLTRFLSSIGEHEFIAVGSSIKSCMVAEGRVDLYARLGPTSEWDTAAAQCIVEEAGGVVTQLSGEPLLYNTKKSLLNPHFLVIGDQQFDWLAHFKESAP